LRYTQSVRRVALKDLRYDDQARHHESSLLNIVGYCQKAEVFLPSGCIQAVDSRGKCTFEAGYVREGELFMQCMVKRSAAQTAFFFAERAASCKIYEKHARQEIFQKSVLLVLAHGWAVSHEFCPGIRYHC